jgi:hypothetical protein
VNSPAGAQTLTGTSGLITVPTAVIAPDGDLTLGVNRLAREHFEFTGGTFDDRPLLVHYANVGFLPFVEVGLRLTRLVDVPRQALGDRMVNVRVRLLKEGELLPAVAVGAHDIVGTRIYHASYAVATKTVGTAAGPVGLTVGYGYDVLRLPSRGRQFDGLFGGVSVTPRRWITLLAEYDGEQPNAGVRLRPVQGVALLAALRNLGGLSAGVSYTFALH